MRLSDAPQLSNTLNLKFNLAAETNNGAQVIAIPSSLLRPNVNLGITLSKISAWPVMTYARIYPEGRAMTYDKAGPIIAELLQTEEFFVSDNFSSDCKGQSDSFQCGLDVEKLSFTVAEAKQPEIGENYWLIIGLKRTNSEIISQNNPNFQRIYEDFSIRLSIETRPYSVIPLLILLLATFVVYFGFLRKYHLRLFALK